MFRIGSLCLAIALVSLTSVAVAGNKNQYQRGKIWSGGHRGHQQGHHNHQRHSHWQRYRYQNGWGGGVHFNGGSFHWGGGHYQPYYHRPQWNHYPHYFRR